MSRTSWAAVFLFAAMAIAVAGFLALSNRPPSAGAVVLVSYQYPGASPQVSNDIVAMPVFEELTGCAGSEKITAISTNGQAEIYIIGKAGFDGTKLLELVQGRIGLAASVLPRGASLKQCALLGPGEGVPAAKPRMVDGLSINVDRAKSDGAGVRIGDIYATLEDEMKTGPGASAERLAALPLRTVGGKSVLMGDFVTFQTTKVPDTVVRTYP
jgi:hypothetical protein